MGKSTEAWRKIKQDGRNLYDHTIKQMIGIGLVAFSIVVGAYFGVWATSCIAKLWKYIGIHIFK